MATPLMNLTLPTVSVTLGPQWANEVNQAFTVIDSHDHSSSKGTKVTPNGININANLDFVENNILNLALGRFSDRSATQTGASNSNSLYTVGGDFYFTNGSGTAIQITSGGALVSSPGAIVSYVRQNVASNLIISAASGTVVFDIDTSVVRTITLPAANAVADGRIYIFKDKSGTANTNNITVNRVGSDVIDGETSIVIDSDYGSSQIVGNGTDNWSIV